MQELTARHEPIDVISLSHQLKEKKLLESIGGGAFLTELTQSVPASTNAKYYAEIVNKKFVLRSLIDASEYVSEIAFNDGSDEVDEVLDKAERPNQNPGHNTIPHIGRMKLCQSNLLFSIG